MSDKVVKWKGPYEKIVSVTAKAALKPDLLAQLKPAGCFLFNDGTDQGWSLDQLYGWFKGPNYDPINNPNDLIWKKMSPFTQYLPWNGFSIGNHQNLALSAYVPTLYILDPDVVKCSFYFESPDLSSYPQWQNSKGYSLDIHRLFFSTYLMFGNPPNKTIYSAQLQMKVIRIDTTTGKPKIDPSTNQPYYLYAQWDSTTNQFIDNPIDFNKNYNFTFKPTILSNPPQGEETKIHRLRIRCTMLGYLGKGQGETAGGGHWLIGNICPELTP